ncbi:MAG: lipopolysaccharide heptosyltransferase II [Candidatus Omnitrophota bacterium]
MNILQVVPELNIGGVETGVLDLSKYLVKHGHRSIVVSKGGSLVRELERDGARHYILDVKTKSLFSVIRMIPYLVEIIKRERVDIIHARSRVPAWISFFAARQTKITFITTCHGYYSRHIFSRVMGWGKLIIVPSRVIARHMIEDFKVPQERIVKIDRSVDLEKFKFNYPRNINSDKFNIAIIGRITPIKGHICFIEAISKLISDIPNLKAYIVGSVQEGHEDYFNNINLLIKKLALSPYIEFTGRTDNIASVLNDLDLLVMPSIAQESFGRVIIEAQAVGVPVIASRIGGIVDIIDDNKTGIMFTPGDYEELAKKIFSLYQDKDLQYKLIINARKKVETNYNVDKFASLTIDTYNRAIQTLKILVIKLSSLGDIILIIPSLRALRKKFPNAKISVLVGRAFSQALVRCPYIDEVIAYDWEDKHKGIGGFFKIASLLKRKNFDKVIDLQNNKASQWLSFLSLTVERYGYERKFGSLLLTHRVKDKKIAMAPIEHQFKTLGMLDIKLEDAHLELWPDQRDYDFIERFLKAHWLIHGQILIGINLSASIKWQTKQWPFEQIILLCNMLAKKDYRIVFTGSQKEEALANKIAKSLDALKPIIAVGKTTINELAALIKRCNVFITADSAPMHVAAAMSTPFIALFGPTDPKRHMPCAEKFILIKKDIKCSPCYRPKCMSHECMHKIEVEEVVDAVDKLLK